MQPERAALWLALVSGLATIGGWLLFFLPFASAADLGTAQAAPSGGDPGWVAPVMLLLISAGLAVPALAAIVSWRGLHGRAVRPLNAALFALLGALVLVPFALSAQPLIGAAKLAFAVLALSAALTAVACAGFARFRRTPAGAVRDA